MVIRYKNKQACLYVTCSMHCNAGRANPQVSGRFIIAVHNHSAPVPCGGGVFTRAFFLLAGLDFMLYFGQVSASVRFFHKKFGRLARARFWGARGLSTLRLDKHTDLCNHTASYVCTCKQARAARHRARRYGGAVIMIPAACFARTHSYKEKP